MQIKYNDWNNRLEEFSGCINGDLIITKNPAAGTGANYLTGNITLNYHYNKLVITQNVIKDNFEICFPSFLHLEYSYSNPNNFKIYLNQRDFFSKLFSGNRISSGNKIFDKKFTITSSDRRLALILFKEERIQKLFLENPLLVFNVQTKKGETTIKIKSMAKKLYTKKEMLYYLEEFKLILNKILE